MVAECCAQMYRRMYDDFPFQSTCRPSQSNRPRRPLQSCSPVSEKRIERLARPQPRRVTVGASAHYLLEEALSCRGWINYRRLRGRSPESLLLAGDS
jgi:hypothetical protein